MTVADCRERAVDPAEASGVGLFLFLFLVSLPLTSSLFRPFPRRWLVPPTSPLWGKLADAAGGTVVSLFLFFLFPAVFATVVDFFFFFFFFLASVATGVPLGAPSVVASMTCRASWAMSVILTRSRGDVKPSSSNSVEMASTMAWRTPRFRMMPRSSFTRRAWRSDSAGLSLVDWTRRVEI